MEKDMIGKVLLTADCFAGFVERAAQAEAQLAYERDKRWCAEAKIEDFERKCDAMELALKTAEKKLAIYEQAGVYNDNITV